MTLTEKYMGTVTYPGAPAIAHNPSECWWCRHAAIASRNYILFRAIEVGAKKLHTAISADIERIEHASLADMARDILARDSERAAIIPAAMVTVGTEEDLD